MRVAVAKSFVLAVVLFVGLFAQAGDQFPIGPNPTMTPGSLCQDPSTHRYAENIDYCERDVSTQTKNGLIRAYDQKLGFKIGTMSRNDFKIDHFIPLSIGGSNSADNLWPQHKSVYKITDPLEQLLSDKMISGHIRQSEAVRIVREAKLNLDHTPKLIQYVQGL